MSQTSDEQQTYKATCGCGFSVETSDPDNGLWTYQNHPCPNEDTAWYGHVFSVWGFAIFAFAGWILLQVLA